MVKPRVAYVVAGWSGPRRGFLHKAARAAYRNDRTVFLRKNLEAAVRNATIVDRYVVVAPECPGEPPEFTRYVAAMAQAHGGPKVLRPKNDPERLAIGSLNCAFGVLRDEFDYWILCEDDHAFVKPGFDRDLVDRIDAFGPKCGYVSAFAPSGVVRMEEGVTTTRALGKMHDRFGEIPCGYPKLLPHAFGMAGLEVRSMQLAWRVLVKWKGRPKLAPPTPGVPVGVVALDYVLAAKTSKEARKWLRLSGVDPW